MTNYNGPLALIGDTPIVELTHLDTGPCRLFAKLESQNPGGSIKDRIAVSMIDAAEKSGALKPGGRIVEATAGNTGLALALVATLRGYTLTLVIPDKMSREKIAHVRALGAEVILTRSDVPKGHPEYYQDLAQRIAKETGAFFVDQFNNPNNPAAHERSTGPEIYKQLDGKVDAIVAGVGSGGTITGISRYFARVSPATDIVLADPKGSILAEYIKSGDVGEAGSWLVEGIGEDFVPPVSDLSRVTHAYTITDGESFAAARELLLKEGILAGSSSGTLLAAALRYCREQTEPKRVVTLICDSGNKYLSKMYDDRWLTDQGLLERPRFGDLRDLIARRHDEHAVVTVGPEDTLQTAYSRMKLYDVSQVPVLDGDRCVGLLDESDLLVALTSGTLDFHRPVKAAMAAKVETVQANRPPESLLPLFDRGLVAVVVDGERFLGLITRIDLLNHLRRKMD
ncbi:Pyridoxal-5'-phosphate-dependent protein beta subunit [Rhodomicrobium vannielii ATCC 17100]|uniref:Cysteine synthase B n=1 Tax=Rhodomicrobium vannielii (strain ATCC 17100 / DSM 162 / LMG 4299 / NCIMB 10020 / ATH 3.1.1) TaxID=648757 RepID=E3I058_RHOVT|nr:cystathionine beta-synthase [Rhodomicrobium vannielii]ADP71093.1 Pyridoxal-5'-phosphate-dependent protein beta subunit [Rhodomicrobium vannielii ATCC 17100]